MFTFPVSILFTTLWVKLKIESLSGLTERVVSIKKVKGGLMTSLPTDTGHCMQLQATHLPVPPAPAQSASLVQVHPSLKQGSEGKSLHSLDFKTSKEKSLLANLCHHLVIPYRVSS